MSTPQTVPTRLPSGRTAKRRLHRAGSGPRLINRVPFWVHIPVWLYAFALAIPLWFVLVSASKDNSEIFNHPFLPPQHYSLHDLQEAWTRTSMGQAMINSILIVVVSLALSLLLAIPASFALARSKNLASRLMERAFAAGMLIPGFAALIPTVLLAIHMKLFHHRLFMMLYFPATALPLTVLLLTQFMRTVPTELEESARLDGASTWQTLWHVYAPVVQPGVVTTIILNFLSFWNEYLFSLVLLGSDPDTRTIQVAVPTLSSVTSTDYGILMAGCLLSIIPTVVIYAVAQRRLEEAMLQGAVKG